MVEITAALVKELRDATGISILKCRQALAEASGDLEKARVILRKQGEADAAKRSEKTAGEGVIAVKISENAKKGALLQLFCETDFVAKSDDFTNLAEELAGTALEKDAAEMKSASAEKIRESIQKNGENIKLGAVEILEGEKIASYLHSNKKIGVLVSFSGDAETGKDVAMQVAALNPRAVNPAEISDEETAKEKEIQQEMLAEEGKPAELIEKILEGKLRKFREEQSLMKQAFVKDASKTVETFLQEKKAKVEKFARLAI